MSLDVSSVPSLSMAQVILVFKLLHLLYPVASDNSLPTHRFLSNDLIFFKEFNPKYIRKQLVQIS